MDAAKATDKKVLELATSSNGTRASKNTNKLLRGKHQLDAALVSLNEFPELQAELRGFREKLWSRFLELER